MTPQIKARLEKHFQSEIRLDGKVMTCKEYYQTIQNNGYTNIVLHEYSDGVRSYRLENNNGSLYEIPKMVYDYLKETQS